MAFELIFASSMPRHLIALLCWIAAVGLTPLQAQSEDPSELYVTVWRALQEGEKLEGSGQFKEALARYRFAGSVLDQLHEKAPEFQPLIVEFRKRKTSEAIQKLEQKIALSPEEPTKPADGQEPLPESGPNLTSPAAQPSGDEIADATRKILDRISELQEELKQSKKQVSSLQNEKETVAKRLNDTIRELDKSKASEIELQSRQAETEEALKKAIAQAEKEMVAQAQRNSSDEALRNEFNALGKKLKAEEIEREALQQLNEDLQRRSSRARKLALDSSKERDEASSRIKEYETKFKKIDQLTSDLEAKQKELELLRNQNRQANEQIAAVTKERDEALAQAAKAKETQAQVERLLADNAGLMQKLSDAEKAVQQFSADAPKKDELIANLQREVSTAKELLVANQKEYADFKSSVADMQQQLDANKKALAQIQNDTSITSDERAKLTQENDLLRGIIMRELKTQARREQSKTLALEEMAKLNTKSNVLIQQIDYLSQPVIKLSEEEQALFKNPQVKVLESGSSGVSISVAAPKEADAKEPTEAASATPTHSSAKPSEVVQDLPAKESTAASSAPAVPGKSAPLSSSSIPGAPQEMVPLAQEAKGLFEREQYREAEKIYERMLSKEPNNIYALSNLGVTRFRAGKLALAEETFKKAIAIAPEDYFSHSTLGIVYYQQDKLDEAVAALTRALTLNSKYSVAHNYLGIAASKKGWQEAAQKELETAIAIDPNYADAHFNLAVVNATKRPPNKEEAQRLYKRATELGAEPDPALENLLK